MYERFAEPKELHWIEAADHFFAGGLDALEEAVRGLPFQPVGAHPHIAAAGAKADQFGDGPQQQGKVFGLDRNVGGTGVPQAARARPRDQGGGRPVLLYAGVGEEFPPDLRSPRPSSLRTSSYVPSSNLARASDGVAATSTA